MIFIIKNFTYILTEHSGWSYYYANKNISPLTVCMFLTNNRVEITQYQGAFFIHFAEAKTTKEKYYAGVSRTTTSSLLPTFPFFRKQRLIVCCNVHVEPNMIVLKRMKGHLCLEP